MRTLEYAALAVSGLLLLGWGAWWVVQVLDVIELLSLAYDW
jgi:hypothetical protein